MPADNTGARTFDSAAPQEVVSEYREHRDRADADLDVDGLETSWFSKLKKYFDLRSK